MDKEINELRERQDKTLHEEMLLKAVGVLGKDFNWGRRGGNKESRSNSAYCLLKQLVEKDRASAVKEEEVPE